MIKFLSKLPLFKLVYRQGGIDSFALAQKDILETMADDLDKRANELVDDKISLLLSAVDSKRIATFNEKTKQYFIGGELATNEQLAVLKQEADMIKTLSIWPILIETPKELAEQSMFVKGETLADLQKGRSMLYTIATQQKIVELFSGYTHR